MWRVCLLLVLVDVGGCAGGKLYPGTDLVEPANFELVRAQGLVKGAEGQLVAGTLEYGGGEAIERDFRGYVLMMTRHGWQCVKEDIAPERARAMLQKGTRTCHVEFGPGGKRPVRAEITVSSGS